MDVLEDIYAFFSESTKRNKAMADATKEIENALKLRNLPKTRWVYCSESIDAVWRSYEQIPGAIDAAISGDNMEGKIKAKAARCFLKLSESTFLKKFQVFKTLF